MKERKGRNAGGRRGEQTRRNRTTTEPSGPKRRIPHRDWSVYLPGSKKGGGGGGGGDLEAKRSKGKVMIPSHWQDIEKKNVIIDEIRGRKQ